MAPLTRSNVLLLGIDGGGTTCRARLTDWSGHIRGQATSGPANIRFGLQQSIAAITNATGQCLTQAGLIERHGDIVACLALAGACEPSAQAQANAVPLPFRSASLTSDAKAACVGAHCGEDGAIVIVGTGTVAWSIVGGYEFRVGGWGFPLSDQGSGAWLGSRALMHVLQAHDRLRPWTLFLRSLFAQFQSDPYAIVRWMTTAGPREYASLAPSIVTHARQDDVAADNLMRSAGAHIDALIDKIAATGASRVALLGGLSPSIKPYLSGSSHRLLVEARGDAMSGALRMARVQAASLLSHEAADP